jgi:hypothetical protein
MSDLDIILIIKNNYDKIYYETEETDYVFVSQCGVAGLHGL